MTGASSIMAVNNQPTRPFIKPRFLKKTICDPKGDNIDMCRIVAACIRIHRTMKSSPIILAIGGHDPTGGAGLQADIETIHSMGCRAISLVTCLTRQDSRNVISIHPQPYDEFNTQLRTLLNDIQPAAIKIGLIGDNALVPGIRDCLQTAGLPVVLDPVLAAGGGTPVATNELIASITEHLLPETALVTPNRAEARRLSGYESMDDAARQLIADGTANVLITGADEAEGEQVNNRLYLRNMTSRNWLWPRLPYSYHGSGCTLASACACGLARGTDVQQCVEAAQQFTWDSLNAASKPGQGQHLPTRYRT